MEAKKLNVGDMVTIRANGGNRIVTNVTVTYDHQDSANPSKITNLTALVFCNDGNLYRHNEVAFV